MNFRFVITFVVCVLLGEMLELAHVRRIRDQVRDLDVQTHEGLEQIHQSVRILRDDVDELQVRQDHRDQLALEGGAP